MLALYVERLTVRFGAVTAVDDLDLGVTPGERVGILGPSGCGKTTLLRTIAGLERPAAGHVRWEGRDLARTPVHARRFGLMFQDFALFPHRDVRDNVAFGLRMQRLPAREVASRVDEVLALVGLEGYGRRMATSLSGGEQQRVALARALAPRPRLLMLDEPLGSLDRVLRERLLSDLTELLAGLGITTLYVTHDREEAFSIGDRVLVLRAGAAEADASPDELWRRPPNEFVARFLGFANIADATIADGVVRTPWGAVRSSLPDTGDGEQRVLLRPDSFVLAADGQIVGTVETRMFRGDHVRLRVAVAGAPPLEVAARWPHTPDQGEMVRLTVDPDGVVPLPPASARVAR